MRREECVMASHPCRNIHLFQLFGCFIWLNFTLTHARENRVSYGNYKHLTLEEGHLALKDLKSLDEELTEDLGFNEQGSLDQKREDGGLIGGVANEDVIEDLFGMGPQVLTMNTEPLRSWFSSQVIHTTEPSQQEYGGIHTTGDNRLLAKAPGSDTESTRAKNGIENFTITTPMQHKENLIKGLVTSSDGTWMIGYPGHLEEEGGNAGDNATEHLEEQSQESNMEDNLPKTSNDVVFKDPIQVMEWKGKTDEGEVDTPKEAVLDLHNEWTNLPPTFSKEVIETFPPTTLSLEDTTISRQDPRESATTPIMVTRLYKGYTGRNFTQPNTETKFQSTKELCRDDRGHLVTIVVVAISAMMVAVVASVWCYRKMQQKKCAHQISGEGQSRPGQHVEMQQKI